jgi:mycoredoxin-dependent peroxiredoxin
MATTSATVTVGDPAPDFTLNDASGETVTLSELRGSPVVLVFLRGFG